MTVPVELVEEVRRRSAHRCEYCSVTETDAGGPLTIDHFRPSASGGDDDLGNLLYCCYRYNLYKADYWPLRPEDATLWNPRLEPAATHFLHLADGTLHPLTPSGAFTLRRLRLNRPQLVALRLSRAAQSEELHLATRYREVLDLLNRLQEQHAVLLEDHRRLLEEQGALLRLLLRRL